MAFASVGTLGATFDKVAGTSIVLTTTATAAAGSFVVVIVAKDNASSTTGETSEITSVSDSAGNTWTKAYEYSYGGGTPGANAGAVCAVYFSTLSSALSSGGTITANFSDSRTASAISAWNYSLGAGNLAELDGATGYGDTNNQNGLSLTGLTSAEHLGIRAFALETQLTTAFALESGWTAMSTAGGTGGGSASNMRVDGQFGIESASTTVDVATVSGPSALFVDQANILVAFIEVAGPNTGTASGSIAFTGSSAGTVTVQGTASGTIALTGSSEGTAAVSITGTSAGSIGFTGASTGVVAVQGAASGSIALTGASAGAVAVSGSASGEIAFTGSGVGVVPVVGLSGGSIDFTGTATGQAITAVAAIASGVIDFSGFAIGQLIERRYRTGRGHNVAPLIRSGQSTVRGRRAGASRR